MVKFLSNEWIDVAKKYLIEEVDPQEDLNGLSTSLLGIVEHIPPQDTTMGFYFEFENGNLKDFIVTQGDTIEGKDPTYIVNGNYGTYKDVLQGKTSLTIALLKNRLKLKRNKLQALKIIKPLDKVILTLITVTDEFD
jgi:putative sterol carrier protein